MDVPLTAIGALLASRSAAFADAVRRMRHHGLRDVVTIDVDGLACSLVPVMHPDGLTYSVESEFGDGLEINSRWDGRDGLAADGLVFTDEDPVAVEVMADRLRPLVGSTLGDAVALPPALAALSRWTVAAVDLDPGEGTPDEGDFAWASVEIDLSPPATLPAPNPPAWSAPARKEGAPATAEELEGKPFSKLTEDEANTVVREILLKATSDDDLVARLDAAGFSGGAAAISSEGRGLSYMAMVMVWGPNGETITGRLPRRQD